MDPRAAARAPKAPPARRGGLDAPTVATGSGRLALVDPVDTDAPPRRLLPHIAGELPMRPPAALLVAHFPQTHSCLEVAHIPHRDLADPLSLAEVHHLARGLMQQ